MFVTRVKYRKLTGTNFALQSLTYVEPEIKCDVKNINDVVEINPSSRKFDIKSYEDDYVEYVELSSVDRETGKIKKLKKSPKEQLSKRARLIAKKGDILIPLIGVKNFTPTLIERDSTIVSDNYAVIVPKVEDKYIYSVFWDEYVISQIKARYKGGTILRLSIGDLKTINIPWPNEDDRNNKVKVEEEKLKKVLNVRNKNNLDIDKVNEVFKDAFKVSIDNSKLIKKLKYSMLDSEIWNASCFLKEELELIENKDFKVMSLKEVCGDISLGINVSKYKTNDQETPMIRPSNISNFSIEEPFKEQSFDINKALEKADFKVKENDILIRVRGNVGMAAFIEKKHEGMVFNDSLLRLRGNVSKIYFKYLWCFLNSYIAQKQITDYSKDGTMSYINQRDIQKVKIIVPPIERQYEIVNEILEVKENN